MWPAASTVVTAAIVKATTSRFGPISPDNPSIRPCSICAAVSAESLPASTAGEAAVAEPEQQRRGQRYFLTALTRPINESDGLHVNYRARSHITEAEYEALRRLGGGSRNISKAVRGLITTDDRVRGYIKDGQHSRQAQEIAEAQRIMMEAHKQFYGR